MTSLQIAGPETATLDAGRSATVNFTLTNGSGRKLSALLRPVAGGTAREEWFAIQGETARSMEPGESMIVAVAIRVPPGAAPGEASLRLRATNENDANNDWADSATCTFAIPVEAAVPTPPPPPPPPPMPVKQNWLLWAVIAVLAIVVGAGALYLWKNHDSDKGEVTPSPTPEQTKRPLPPLKQLGRFIEPKIGSHRLNWCLTQNANCGKPAADVFCRSKGFNASRSRTIDANIGLTKPTKALGDGSICNKAFCDGFKSIQCSTQLIVVPVPLKK